jgi:hypothetical protein
MSVPITNGSTGGISSSGAPRITAGVIAAAGAACATGPDGLMM